MGMKSIGPRLRGKRLAVVVVGVLWAAALFGVALPAWREALDQHREVSRLEDELRELDRWTVAGLWLERSLGARTAAVEPVWDRLFPAERRREELFLDLARVADRSGIDAFELREMFDDEAATIIEPDDLDDLDAAADAGASEAELDTYRVRARFEGEYDKIAGFLGGLRGIERAVTVHDLEIRPVRDVVQVELELDIYVRKTTGS